MIYIKDYRNLKNQTLQWQHHINFDSLVGKSVKIFTVGQNKAFSGVVIKDTVNQVVLISSMPTPKNPITTKLIIPKDKIVAIEEKFI